MSLLVLASIVIGLLLATRVAGQKNRQALDAHQRAELARACLSVGVAADEVEALVRQRRDAELMALFRRFTASRALREGPFR